MRSVFAITGGCAFIALVIRWLINVGVTASDTVLLVLPWALGSFAGVVVMQRLNRSTVVGGILGGGCGALLCWAIDMVRTMGLWPWPAGQLVLIFAFAMCGGGLLAAIVAVIREGLSIRSKRDVCR